MSKNTQLIQQLEDHKNLANDRTKHRVLVPFKLKEIQRVGEHFKLRDNVLEPAALKQVAGRLQVKPQLFDTAGEEKWDRLQDALNTVNGEKTAVARVDEETQAVNYIVNNKGEEKAENVDFSPLFDQLIGCLGVAEHEFALRRCELSKKSDSVEIELIRRGEQIDVFGDNDDIWDAGVSFQFLVHSFSQHPFFERLICSNGMTAMEKGDKIFTRVQNFNAKRIPNMIHKALMGDTGREYIQKGCNRLRARKVSLNEFYSARDVLRTKKSENGDDQLDLAVSLFDDSHIVGAYGPHVKNHTKEWLSTANSNVNAYDFFNACTWIDSHREKAGVTENQGQQFRKLATDIFFKDRLDLDNIAPNPFKGN